MKLAITDEEMNEIVDCFEDKFTGWGMFDFYYYELTKQICIDIEGDWKHAHLRCDCLMEELGYKKVDEFVTDENGSDWYASIHSYIKEVDNNDVKRLH